MITRLVQLDISPAHIDAFIQIFESARPRILRSEGCLNVVLLQNVDSPSKLSTLSTWESTEALNLYRGTDFFKETWAASRQLFQGRAQASSHVTINK